MSTVIVSPYSQTWPLAFARIRADLLDVFTDARIDIQHIGSTSVPDLAAKPVIDVLLGADSLTIIEDKIGALERWGYRYVPKYERELPMRRYFVKAEGERFGPYGRDEIHGPHDCAGCAIKQALRDLRNRGQRRLRWAPCRSRGRRAGRGRTAAT